MRAVILDALRLLGKAFLYGAAAGAFVIGFAAITTVSLDTSGIRYFLQLMSLR